MMELNDKLTNLLNAWEKDATELMGVPVKLLPIIEDDRKVKITKLMLINIVKKHVANVTKVDIQRMETKTRKPDVVQARYMCYYLWRDFNKHLAVKITLNEMGSSFSGQDHSNVIHGLRVFKDHLDT